MIFTNDNRIEVAYGVFGPASGRNHKGQDIDTTAADRDVHSTVAGRVKWARCVAKGAAGWGNTWEWGWFVWIDAPDGTSHIFAHMQANSLRVKEGQNVAAGQVLGVMGKTGNAAGDKQAEHVHYEVRKNGVAVDPTPWSKVPNKVGTVWNTAKERKDQMWCFDVAEGGKLEVFTAPDVNATVRTASGTRRLPAGKSILLKEVTLSNMPAGTNNKGVYIELEGTHERFYAAAGLGHCEIVQNDTQSVLDRFYPAGGTEGGQTVAELERELGNAATAIAEQSATIAKQRAKIDNAMAALR